MWHFVMSTGTLRCIPLIGLCRGWPEELGGPWYPTERGPYSTDFLHQLTMDAPDLPMWLDPENSSNAAAADRVPKETFAFMPDWLGSGYYLRGRKGYWEPRITGNIAQQVCNLQAVLRKKQICLTSSLPQPNEPCAMHAKCVYAQAMLAAQALMMSCIKHHLALLHVALFACSAVVHVSSFGTSSPNSVTQPLYMLAKDAQA